MKRSCAVLLALAVCAAWSSGGDRPALRKPNIRTTRLDEIVGSREQAVVTPGNPKLPPLGTEIGTTWMDWPCNGNVLNQISVDGNGGVHFSWTFLDATLVGTTRRYMYNYRTPGGTYLDPVAFSEIPGNRWGSSSCTYDGKGIAAYHFSYYEDSISIYPPMFSYDAGCGTGSFITIGIDTANARETWHGLPWVHLDVNRNPANSDTIYVMGRPTSQFIDSLYPVFNCTYNQGLTWCGWTDLKDGGAFAPFFPEQNMAAGSGGKVAISLVDLDNRQVYRESSDYGQTWGPTTVAVDPLNSDPQGDTIVPYIHTSLFYDNDNNLHIVNSYYSYNYSVTGDSTLNWTGIFDWTAANGVRYVTKELTTDIQWYATNALNYGWPNMVQHADGTYKVVFAYFDSIDVAANGYANGDIWYTLSNDGGATWYPPFNLTNSQSPGATAGFCEDDAYPDCAIYGDTLHIIWLNSKDAGQAYQGYGTTTEDTYWHATIHYLVGGLTGNQSPLPTYGFALNQSRPNPVRHSAEISFNLPQAGEYEIKIFNVAGQSIKEFKGQGQAGINSVNWNAGKVTNGVYFYKLTSGGSSATRKMVVLK